MTGQEIKEILRKNGVNQSELADLLGITAQTLHSRLNARYFKPEYMAEINGVLGKNILAISDINFSDGIPVYDIRACAGNGIGLENSEKIIEYVNIPTFKGCYGLSVYGDSMRGKYNSGDTIFVRPCNGIENIEYGRSYVIITHDDIYIKMIYQSRISNHIRICSYNPELTPSGERAYPDMDIHLNDIQKIYKVVGRIEHELM